MALTRGEFAEIAWLQTATETVVKNRSALRTLAGRFSATRSAKNLVFLDMLAWQGSFFSGWQCLPAAVTPVFKKLQRISSAKSACSVSLSFRKRYGKILGNL
jgi:hypothetical protein